nr:MAG TPA: Cro/C1-type HTH DNA-binding domain protein [Caudoviricetes sp.]
MYVLSLSIGIQQRYNIHWKGGFIVPIKYDKLLKMMANQGITSYTLKRDNIIGQATFKKIKEGGDIDTRTIAKLCKLLNCQPGDILEYTPEDEPKP